MSSESYHPGRFKDFLLDELWRAYAVARLGKRSTFDEHRFEINDIENIRLLRDSIMRRVYRPSRGVAFIVKEPVIREIVAAPFRDRVIHHFVFNYCGDWWDRHFIYDSYSCRKGKGTLFGQQRLFSHIRSVSKNNTEKAYVLKLDIMGYFMHLPKQKLYERAVWGLNRQFYPKNPTPEYFLKNQINCHAGDREELYRVLKFLWHEIIFDKPMEGISIRGSRDDWDQLPPTKSLFNQPPNRGIVIGNLTSQLLSNIYLDQLDRFITQDLGYKHYGRYVDDFYIVVPERQCNQLLRDVAVIEKYLDQKLNLTLHPKKRYFQTADHGIPFIGAVVYPQFVVSGRRSRTKLFKAAYKLATVGEGTPQDLCVRMGTSQHLNNWHLYKKVFETFGWDF